MRDLNDLFEALGRSEFRSRFRLGTRESAYLREKGLEIVLGHARDFIEKRLAPAEPAHARSAAAGRGWPPDPDAESPSLHRSARHGDLLSGLLGEMAPPP